MTVNYISKDTVIEPTVVPSIRLTEDGKYYNAFICIDHIYVAYFTLSGGIAALPFTYRVDGSWGVPNKEDVEYLQRKGVKMEQKEEIIETRSDWVTYYIQLGRG